MHAVRRTSREFQQVMYDACTDSGNKDMFGKEKVVQQSEDLETLESSEVPSGPFEKIKSAKSDVEPAGREGAIKRTGGWSLCCSD